jgi:predicted MFS family arabinose efflux permease
LAAALLFVSGLAFVPYMTYLSAFLRDEHGWTIAAAGHCWSLIGVGGMFGGFLLGAVSDRISVKWTLVLTCGLMLLASLALSLPDLPWLVYAGSLTFGLGYYAIFGLMAAYVAKAFDPGIATPLQGVTFVAVGCGSMIGNYAGSLMAIAAGSYAVVYCAAALGSALLILGTLLLPRERDAGFRLE